MRDRRGLRNGCLYGRCSGRNQCRYRYCGEAVIGGVTVDLQNICNMICPKLVPAALVGFVYWLLGKKGMTSTKAIFIVLVLSIALGAFGIICKG